MNMLQPPLHPIYTYIAYMKLHIQQSTFSMESLLGQWLTIVTFNNAKWLTWKSHLSHPNNFFSNHRNQLHYVVINGWAY